MKIKKTDSTIQQNSTPIDPIIQNQNLNQKNIPDINPKDQKTTPIITDENIKETQTKEVISPNFKEINNNTDQPKQSLINRIQQFKDKLLNYKKTLLCAVGLSLLITLICWNFFQKLLFKKTFY